MKHFQTFEKFRDKIKKILPLLYRIYPDLFLDEFPASGRTPAAPGVPRLLALAVAILTVLNHVFQQEYRATFILKGGRAAYFWVKIKKRLEIEVGRDFDYRLCAPGMTDPNQRLGITADALEFVRWCLRRGTTFDNRDVDVLLIPPSTVSPTDPYRMDILGVRVIEIIGMAATESEDCRYDTVPIGVASAAFCLVRYRDLVEDWIRQYCYYAQRKQQLKRGTNLVFVRKARERLRALYPALVDQDRDRIVGSLHEEFPEIPDACLGVLARYVFNDP